VAEEACVELAGIVKVAVGEGVPGYVSTGGAGSVGTPVVAGPSVVAGWLALRVVMAVVRAAGISAGAVEPARTTAT
jgi:hypothetical protein